ncbi:fibroblast growth factor 10-like isoform X3 [Rhopalosiphum maidis]|nr:fibroblast growth factor 10-like isoform X3 [Rhopalosiphum maidis]XP_026813075.1 fibroblast growth factor 10-like isoform X3 [Rhopalosiphum maidis]XP_026813076.1 fibroblast growth factor 10-like isoform X3 [Rhopalosiphum maidis]
MKLNCRHGYNILILQNGKVSSSDDDIDSHCIMEFTSMSPGHVRIKGVEANLFLAMNKDGLLYGEADPNNNSTIFIEQPEGPYSAYLSLKYQRKKCKRTRCCQTKINSCMHTCTTLCYSGTGLDYWVKYRFANNWHVFLLDRI